MQRLLSIVIKSLWRLALLLTFIVVAAYYVIQLPAVQTSLSHRATQWLSEKLGANLEVGHVRINWLDDATLENVRIYDLKGRPMIIVPEIYVNFKTNFSFDWKKIVRFDNNLDYVLLNKPEVNLHKEKDGALNFDEWISKIQKLSAKPKKDTIEHNIPFTIDDAFIQEGTFRFIDNRKKRFPKEEFDYYNFTISDINGKVNRFFIQGDTLTFTAKELKGIDKRSELTIKELQTDFFYCKTQMHLRHLYGRVNNSIVRDYIGFYYNRPRDFGDFNALVRMKANLSNCSLDAQDLGRFSTNMYAYKERYLLNGDFDGTVEDFKIMNMDLKFGNQSYLKGEVAFKGMPDVEKSWMKYNLTPSYITSEDARQYAGEKNYTHVQKFEDAAFEGTFEGYLNDFVTDVKINSKGLGTASGKIKVKLSDDPTQSTYFGDIVTDNLQLGKIVEQEEYIQKISFKGKIDGQGLTVASAALKVDGFVNQFDFNGYSYRAIEVDGKMKGSVFDGYIGLNDPNLQAEVEGKVNFNPKLNEFAIEGKIHNANLQPLGYSNKNEKLHTEIRLDFQGNKLDDWLGIAHLENTSLRYKERELQIQQLVLYSMFDTEGKRYFQIKSDFFDSEIKGFFVPTQAISDGLALLKEYQLFFTENNTEREAYYKKKKGGFLPKNYFLDYQVDIKEARPFFAYYFPDGYLSPNTKLEGRLRFRNTSEFSMFGKIDSLKYRNSAYYSNSIDLSSSKNALTTDVLSSVVFTSETQRLGNLKTKDIRINGAWGDDDLLLFDGKIKQQNSANYGQVFGQLSILPDGFDIVLDSKNTKFGILGDTWQLAEGNRIFFEDDTIYFDDLELFNQKQHLALEGEMSKNPASKTILTIDNFDLKTLQPLVQYDLKGIMNGDIAISDVFNKSVVTSHLRLDDFYVEEEYFGNVKSLMDWDNTTNQLTIYSVLNRYDKDIFKLVGSYDPNQSADPLHLTAELSKVNLEIAEGLVKDVFSDLGGYANGIVYIKGSPSKPRINGNVVFENGRLRINTLNSYLHFNDNVLLNEKGFVADTDGFEVQDDFSNGHKATIKGGVFYDDISQFRLGLNATVQDRNGFLLMNTTLKDNEYFFGKAYTDGNIQINGTFSDVTITGNLISRRGTKLTIPLDGATEVDVEEEAIPFLNNNREVVIEGKGEIKDTIVAVPKINLSGVKMLFNVTMNPDAECEIIFDRANNDKINARGNGRLTIEYDTRGDLTMAGPYEVQSGKYDFSFQNLASLRKFDIQQGSRIEWTGDPYEASINMNTLYTTNVALREIIGNSASSEELSIRYPVDVTVKLTERLMHPTVTFGLAFRESQIPLTRRPEVLAFEQRLKNDEQLLSRNVSSVLLLNQLFPSNNLVAALNQQFLIDNISNLLSNQIGNIANQLDPNLELGVQLGDVRQNFNNMQLNVAYKYSDRLRLKGNSFYSNGGLTTSSNTAQSQLTVGGEIEYLLTDDGTWRMRAYSRSVPNSTYLFTTTTGNVLVYGVSLQFSRNFNHILPQKKTFPKGVMQPSPSTVNEKKEVSLRK